MFTTSSSKAESVQLHIDTSNPSPTAVTVVVVGEVDLATAPMLRARLLDVIYDQAPEVIDVDLAGVRFLDCAGVHALIDAKNATVQIGHQLWVVHPRSIVHRILEITECLDILTAPSDRRFPPVGAIRAQVEAQGRSATVSRAPRPIRGRGRPFGFPDRWRAQEPGTAAGDAAVGM